MTAAEYWARWLEEKEKESNEEYEEEKGQEENEDVEEGDALFSTLDRAICRQKLGYLLLLVLVIF